MLGSYQKGIKNLKNNDVMFTFGIQATVHDGIALTLGELRSFSDNALPSNVHPSSCKPPSCEKRRE